MTKEEKCYVEGIVESEGFDYAFTCYSRFEKVKDKRFHELRDAYLKAREDLAHYAGLDT